MKYLITIERLSCNDFILEKNKTKMNQEKTEGNRSNEIMSKLLDTQNVMKNKFEKAYINRLEREHNINEAMQPLLITSSNEDTSPSSINETDSQQESSLRNLAISKNKTSQLRLATKSYSNCAIKSQPMSTKKFVDIINNEKDLENSTCKNVNNIHKSIDNPNELCARLRVLLPSLIIGEVKHVEEIKAIIIKLHELEILV